MGVVIKKKIQSYCEDGIFFLLHATSRKVHYVKIN